MANPTDFLIDLKGHNRPPKFVLAETIVSDIDFFNANRSNSRKFDAVNGIEGVVIHATAGSTSGGALQHWRDGAKASAHWIVPGEKEALHGKSIIACVYEARAAFHVRNDKSSQKVNGGRSLINHWTLGIEIVNTQDLQNYSDPYSEWQVNITADIVRYAWAKYPNMRWVFSHAIVDPQRRADPGKQFPWDKFVARVLAGDPEHALVGTIAPQPLAGEMANKESKPCCG